MKAKFIIRGKTELVQALKAEETAQAVKAQADHTRARRNFFERKAQREANRKTAAKYAEAHQSRKTAARVETDTNTPNTADKVRYLIKQAEQEAQTPRQTGATPKGEITPLKELDFLCLYYSNRLLLNGENPREQAGAENLQENEVLKHLKHLNPVVLLTDNGHHTEQANKLYRVSYGTEQANTPQALKYLLSFSTNSRRAENTQTNELRAIKPLISYNNIGYEPNNIIIIGRKATVKGVITEFKRLNKTQHSYYNFIEAEEHRGERKAIKERGELIYRRTARRRKGEAGRRYKASRAKALNKAESTAEREEIKRSMLYHTMYVLDTEKTTYKAQTQKQGLNNIRKAEKEVLKREPRTHHETQEEAKALIEIADKTDGRQTITNIEYDIRKETKYLLSYGANELYYLIIEVENQERGSKKETALLNVLKGYKESREVEEYIQEDIESQQAEADRRSEFKANKKHKNRYNTKYGVLIESRNPQKMRNETNKNRKLTEIAIKERKEEKEKNRKQAIKQEARTQRTTAPNFIKLLWYTHEYRQRGEKYKGAEIIENDTNRNRRSRHIKNLEIEVLNSIYGERTPQEVKMLLKDHRKDNQFKTGLEIVQEASRANIKRKYRIY